MAGEWIKMRIDLKDDPSVFRLAKALRIDRMGVVGRLYALWAWSDMHATGGRIEGAEAADVDDLCERKGFAQALVSVGWLEIGDGFVAIPKHDRHNGNSAKERSLKNARQARWRDGKASTYPQGNRDAQVDADVDGQASTNTSTREEKRREVLITTPSTGSSIARSEPAAGAVPADAGNPAPPPNPRIAAQLDALRVGIPAGTDEHERAGELWAALKANGCKGTASHPAVLEMVRDGVTVAELRGAIAEARKSNDGPLNPAYLAPIIDRLRSGKGKANGKAAAWATDERATEAKATELGLRARPGETYDQLRTRIREAIGKRAAESVR